MVAMFAVCFFVSALLFSWFVSFVFLRRPKPDVVACVAVVEILLATNTIVTWNFRFYSRERFLQGCGQSSNRGGDRKTREIDRFLTAVLLQLKRVALSLCV